MYLSSIETIYAHAPSKQKQKGLTSSCVSAGSVTIDCAMIRQAGYENSWKKILH